MGEQVHLLVIPFPAQGHVKPLMEFSHQLADYGVKVTFMVSEFIYSKIMTALPEKGREHNRVSLVSIPDGLEPDDDLNDHGNLDKALKIMRGYFEELIRKLNDGEQEEKINCIIADPSISWTLEVAENMGIKAAAFWPASVGVLAGMLQIPNLSEAGIIDEDGTPTKTEIIGSLSTMPTLRIDDLMWKHSNDPNARIDMFNFSKWVARGCKIAKWILCNSIYELEPANCDSIPGILPMGPLFATNRLGKPAGYFWQDDSTCLSWLDEQPIRSVVYVAFGSSTIFNQQQFDEVALGLELLDRPFLWVVRPDFIKGADGSRGRVPHCGKIVSWAPQQKVLSHPSIACFLTHCGWNSTIEGLYSGVPFLCWPNFADQFCNQAYICDVWEVGLRLNLDENGTISKVEIKRKVEQLLCDEVIKAKTLKLKEMVGMSTKEGGSSWKNLEDFFEQIKK